MTLRFNAAESALAASMAAAVLMLSGPLPGSALAAADFCSQLGDYKAKISGALDSRSQKWVTARKARDLKLDQTRERWASTVGKARDNWSASRQSNFKKLEEKADTDAEKAAVKAYETSVTNAITVRQAAHDQSRTTFMAAVDNIVSTQRTNLDTQLNSFTADVDVAFTTAQEQCDAGKAGATVHSGLVSDLKDARAAFQNGRKTDSGFAAQIQQLNLARIQANHTADQSFLKATRDARQALRSAFKDLSL
jgi:hypothetical protein